MKGRAQHTFKELCSYLRLVKAKKIYLIHEPYRENEIREFARRLRKQKFIPFVASYYRKGGELYVTETIRKTDISIVVAFDKETVEKARKLGVIVFDLIEGAYEE